MNIKIVNDSEINMSRIHKLIRWFDKYSCYIISILASIVMIIRCFNNDFWVDESYTITAVWNAEGFNILTCDLSCPPIYFIILKLMMELLGYNKFVFHFTSTIPYLILVLFSITRVKQKFGGLSASLFSMFLGIHPEAATYFVEIRPYAWSSLFVFFCFWEGYELLESNGEKVSRWFLFGIFGVMAAYSHYWAFGSTIVIYLCICTVLSLRNHNCIIKSIALCLISLLLYVPWLGVFLRSLGGMSKDFWINQTVSLSECVKFFWCSPIVVILFYVTIIISIMSLLISSIKKSNESIQIKIGWSLENVSNEKWLVMIIACVIGAVYFVETAYGMLIHPLFVTRYLFPVAPAAWLSLSLVINIVDNENVKYILYSVIFCACIVSYLPRYAYIAVTEKQNEIKTEKTIKMINNQYGKDISFLTDIEHLEHGVIEYYFPRCQQELIKFDEKIDDNSYLLLLSCDILETEQVKEYLNENEYTYSLIDNGNLSRYSFYIYLLKKNTSIE